MSSIPLAAFESFQDEPGSPFYRASGLTPQQTWSAINQDFASTLFLATAESRAQVDAAGYARFSSEVIRSYHRDIFGALFPRDAGRFRRFSGGIAEVVYFGIGVGTERTRRLQTRRGAHPRYFPGRIDAICAQFNAAAEKLTEAAAPSLMEGTWTAARFYARLLNAHPFRDGNLRAAFVALQAGLVSLGLRAVALDDRSAHEEALSWALRRGGRYQSYEPLARLLASALG